MLGQSINFRRGIRSRTAVLVHIVRLSQKHPLSLLLSTLRFAPTTAWMKGFILKIPSDPVERRSAHGGNDIQEVASWGEGTPPPISISRRHHSYLIGWRTIMGRHIRPPPGPPSDSQATSSLPFSLPSHLLQRYPANPAFE